MEPANYTPTDDMQTTKCLEVSKVCCQMLETIYSGRLLPWIRRSLAGLLSASAAVLLMNYSCLEEKSSRESQTVLSQTN